MTTTAYASPDVRHTLLSGLTERQFVRPHESVASTLQHVMSDVGIELRDVLTVVFGAGLSPDTSVGRLTRSQLQALAGRLAIQVG
jgi:hypothetical protein